MVRLICANSCHQIVPRSGIALRATATVAARRNVVVVSAVVAGVIHLVQVIGSLAERAFTLARASGVDKGKKRRPVRAGYTGARYSDPTAITVGVIHRYVERNRCDVGNAALAG